MDNETQNSRIASREDLMRRARQIKLLLMDCDGVLTDGHLTLLENGEERKTFHVRDGQGIALCHRAGLLTGIISGRTSSAVGWRARELKMAYVRQCAKDKMAALNEILTAAKITPAECAFIGDDVADIPAMLSVGLAIAVADAVEETRQTAHYITQLPGGQGAVREVCDLILKTQGRWEELMKQAL